ncbi:MAG: hypothetical protein ABL907_24610 [Hyphomicrobium sp.]
MGSRFFQDYVGNINRVNLVEMIEACTLERRSSSFRASLIANPITGLAYDPPADMGELAIVAPG